jgi:hypothetical protein
MAAEEQIRGGAVDVALGRFDEAGGKRNLWHLSN